MKRIVSILTTITMLLTMIIAPISTSAATIKKPAKVSLRSVITISTSSVKVTWKNIEEATGYQIKVSTNNNFSKAKTINTVNASKKTIKKLKSGTKYYVKVRAYTKINGNKKYGNWSKIRTAKTQAKVKKTSSTTSSYSSTYVLNPNSMKVHKKGCRTFKYESRYPTTTSLSWALKNGYSQCKICWR